MAGLMQAGLGLGAGCLGQIGQSMNVETGTKGNESSDGPS